ncbi:Long-chain-fatty-acid--CoA ligase [hydrothermal vent metagenome]|uniref:Long-chain-fatty-acid--CoA ligase n=1 Tax=hydrothermal vent metagenome TaxID=652676 RepID=A0A1W1BU14_9ZZZZ
MSKPLITLPTLTLKSLFEHSTKEYSRLPFVQFVDEDPITYGEFLLKVEQVKEILHKYGIREGDKVALYSGNMPNWSVVYFAVTTMGAVIVPILPDFHISEAIHIANHAKCRAAFISQKLFESMLDERQPPTLNLLVIVDKLLVLEKLSTPSRVEKVIQKGGEQLSKAMDKIGREHSEKKDVEIDEDDLAAIIYTSGTTGNSKGVMLSHKNLTFEAVAAQSMVDIFPEDRFLSILPLAHTYESTVGMIVPFLNGASVHYIKKPPTPTILMKAMTKVKPDFILSVPLVIEKIYKNKIVPNFQKNIFIRSLYKIPFIRKKLHKIAGKKLLESFGGRLRFFGIGGAGVSPTVEKFLREAEFPYCIGYGLTETAPILAGTNPTKTKYRAIGPAIPGVELVLRDKDENGIGTLWAKGPNVMMGYYKDPEKTAEVLTEDGWFNTEDMGYFDSDGYFFMSGRAKNIIVGPSGENIYPEQIEAAINAHDLVVDSLVYDDNGQLAARVYLDYEKLDKLIGINHKSETKTHEKISHILEEIRQNVNSQVSSFSRIKKMIEQRDAFVKTPTKKIKRYLYVEPPKH